MKNMEILCLQFVSGVPVSAITFAQWYAVLFSGYVWSLRRPRKSVLVYMPRRKEKHPFGGIFREYVSTLVTTMRPSVTTYDNIAAH